MDYHPYKTYLKNFNESVPRSTQRYRSNPWNTKPIGFSTSVNHIPEYSRHPEELQEGNTPRLNWEQIQTNENMEIDVSSQAVNEAILYEERPEFLVQTIDEDPSTDHYEHGVNMSNTASVDMEDHEDSDDDSIYPGSKLNREELKWLILSFVCRHNISDVGLQDFLTLLNVVVPDCAPKSKYLLYKDLHEVNDSVKTSIHYFCSNCREYIGNIITSKENGAGITCSSCNVPFCYDTSKKNGDNCIVVPLLPQLTSALQKTILKRLQHSHNAPYNGKEFHNICCGCLYDNFHQKDVPVVSLTVNIDGVPVFSSSKMSMWPIMCTINELPFSKRKMNVLLCGIWFGNAKLRIDTFLKPFITELQQLNSSGVQWIDAAGVHCSATVHMLLMTVDSVARPLLQNFMQFNGVSGCSFCESLGERVEKGRGYVQVYLQQLVNPEKRTHSRVLQQCQTATLQNPVSGVKGASCLLTVPGFDIVNGFTCDIMQCRFGCCTPVCRIVG